MSEFETDGLICGNCCKQLEEDSRTDVIKISNNDPGEIKIVAALAYIYGVSSWEDYQTAVKEENPRSSSELNDFPADESSFYFCNSCATILTNDYQVHKELERASHFSSIVHHIETVRRRNWKPEISPQSPEINCKPPSVVPSSQNEDDNTTASFDSFNFDDREEYCENSSVDIEFKIECNEDLINSEQECEKNNNFNSDSSKFKPTNSTDTNHLKLRELFVKLERLSPAMIAKLRRNADKITKAKKKTDLDYEPARKKRLRSIKIKTPFVENCTICGKTITSKKRLMRHMTMHENIEQLKLKIQCEICGKVLSGTYSLKIHMVIHEDEDRTEMYNCNLCEKSYLRKSGLDEHMLSHSESFTPFLCGQCGKTFDSKGKLTKHEAIHLGGEFQCDICSKLFTTNRYLVRHKRINHVVEKKYFCEECEKIFKHRASYQRHLRWHKEMAESSPVKCDQCPLYLKNNERLEKHKRRMHPEDPKNVCECSVCHKVFPDREALQRHGKRGHKRFQGSLAGTQY